jgi:hypothetical protein
LIPSLHRTPGAAGRLRRRPGPHTGVKPRDALTPGHGDPDGDVAARTAGTICLPGSRVST